MLETRTSNRSDLVDHIDCACLKNLAVLANGLDRDLAFVDRQRRLLALDIFARLDRHDAHQHMPMARSGYHHGVDIRASEDIAKVLGGGTVLVAVLLVDLILCVHHTATVHIAHDQYLCIIPRRLSVLGY